MKRISFVIIAAVALFYASTLHAQSGSTDGCTDSPENPTVILAAVGSTGAALAILRTRLKARKKNTRR